VNSRRQYNVLSTTFKAHDRSLIDSDNLKISNSAFNYLLIYIVMETKNSLKSTEKVQNMCTWSILKIYPYMKVFLPESVFFITRAKWLLSTSNTHREFQYIHGKIKGDVKQNILFHIKRRSGVELPGIILNCS